MDERDDLAQAICREKCAFYGEPPCWRIAPEDWPNPHCDEPGCDALAAAARAAGYRHVPAGSVVVPTSEIEAVRSALVQCRRWFQGYADGHTVKGDTDKAQRNQDRADFAERAALTAPREGQP